MGDGNRDGADSEGWKCLISCSDDYTTIYICQKSQACMLKTRLILLNVNYPTIELIKIVLIFLLSFLSLTKQALEKLPWT